MTTPEAVLMNRLEQVWFDDYLFDEDHWILCDQFAVIAAIDKQSILKSRELKVKYLISLRFTYLECRKRVSSDEMSTVLQSSTLQGNCNELNRNQVITEVLQVKVSFLSCILISLKYIIY